MRAVVVSVVAVLVAGLVVLGAGGGEPARAEYASGGLGLHKGSIDWFEWGADGTPVDSGATRTNVRTIAGEELATTCTLTEVAGAVRTYRPGNWQGDALDDLYNVGGTGTANQLVAGLANTVQGTTVSFRFACSVTLAGEPVPLAGLVVADAEASNTNEYVAATPDQPATWRVIDRDRQAAPPRPSRPAPPTTPCGSPPTGPSAPASRLVAGDRWPSGSWRARPAPGSS